MPGRIRHDDRASFPKSLPFKAKIRVTFMVSYCQYSDCPIIQNPGKKGSEPFFSGEVQLDLFLQTSDQAPTPGGSFKLDGSGKTWARTVPQRPGYQGAGAMLTLTKMCLPGCSGMRV